MTGIRGWRAINYIFFEILPSFLIGLLVFVSIILMFQVLRLTEFALVHGVDFKTISQIVGYICISMLPALFPMSLLFAVLLSYGRLSNDSEVVAMKASGLHMGVLTLPGVIISILIAILSAQTSFEIAPWGNRRFEVLYSQIANSKAASVVKAGTFSEGFFDMVVYANEVDSDKGWMKNIFIYDERQGDTPLTIIAKEGQIVPDPDRPGQSILLRLFNGDIHRKAANHTKIKFETYDLKLAETVSNVEREKSPQSLTLSEIRELLKNPNLNKEDLRSYTTEFHKRWAIAILCPIFALLGVGLGTTTNRRTQKASGMILCILIIVIYWISYIVFEGLSRGGQLPPAIAIWIPNFSFGLYAFQTLRKNWN